MMEIKFGTSGWRGIIARDFTFSGVGRVTQAIADYLNRNFKKKKPVIVGYDTRFLSPEFGRYAAEVLAGNKIPVLFTKSFCPTPVISFVIMKRGLSGGINLTASHNPAEYNGIKFSPSTGAPAPGEVTKDIENRIIKMKEKDIKHLNFEEASRLKLITIIDPEKEYFEQLRKLINFKKIKSAKIKVVLDCMFGTSNGYLDKLLRDSVDLTVINNYRDPLFDGRSSEPDAENLEKLSKLVKEKKADAGIATDGDADRFGIVDETGLFIPANIVIPLLLEHLIKNKKLKGGVVRTLATSQLIDEICEKNKITNLYETPVGFKYIGEKMISEKIIIGGEESGGLSIQGHTPEKDGILADLLILEMLAYEKKPLSKIIKELFKKYTEFKFTRVDLKIKPELKEKILDEFEKLKWNEVLNKKVIKKDKRDGLKLTFNDKSWFLVRPSGTEPKLRIYIEAHSQNDLELLKKGILKLVG
ncbi:MAG TPA: phosphoglucomutase/phosphomannomutase family protein [Firmicutes bacterium]|nr:phosphoglucomutase/phosphomannomutase family protein [Bacillota bacterium]